MRSVLVWDTPEVAANEILKTAEQSCKYRYAAMKIRNARWHIIETHTRRIPEDEWTSQRFVSNGDVPEVA